MLYEIVLNDGESGGFFLSQGDAWVAFSGAEDGVRLVVSYGESIVTEYEKQGGMYVMLAPESCEECSKHTSGECVDCQLISMGV